MCLPLIQSSSSTLYVTSYQCCDTIHWWYSNREIRVFSHAEGTHWSLPHSNKHWTLCWIFMTLCAPRWYVWRRTGEKPVIESGLEHHGRTVNPVSGPLCSAPRLFLHFKSTARQKASFQYVAPTEVADTKCRKIHIYEVRIKMGMFKCECSHANWMQ